MKKEAFDNKLYLKIQQEKILERIKSFDGKLYLEFGGKLFDDFHASRVLPGFQPDSKLRMLIGIKEKVEIIIVVNSNDINSNKIRNDLGITYNDDVLRLIQAYQDAGLFVSGVVLSFYQISPLVDEFESKLVHRGIKVYKHYKINGYPQNIPLVCSEDGLGRNEYIETTKPLIVVTAPGPGSGKMATCLSQLYHDNKKGIRAGYAKYETFPIWNLPLNHPVNVAYEAATIDLKDINTIDPFHLEAYGKIAVNYNRDIEVFPLLKSIFENIYGKSPYNSPTDMGVNMAGFAIVDNDKVEKACKEEVIRRYYQSLKNVFLGKFEDDTVDKAQILMNKLNVKAEDRKCVDACLKKAESCDEPVVAIELSSKKIVTGRRSELFGASAACLLNSLKVLAKIDDSIPLLSRSVIDPIQNLKVNNLKAHNPRLHAEEVLIALAIQASTNPMAELALKQLPKLSKCQAHSSVLLNEADLSTFGKLGIDVTMEPISYVKRLYKKF